MTRQVVVKAKVFILLPWLLFTVFHLSTICRFWYTLLIFSYNGRLRRLVNMQTAFHRKLLFAGFLVPSLLCKQLFTINCCLLVFLFLHPSKCVLVWGTVVRGLRIEIFVRVLRSSRVNLNNVNNTNVFCCV